MNIPEYHTSVRYKGRRSLLQYRRHLSFYKVFLFCVVISVLCLYLCSPKGNKSTDDSLKDIGILKAWPENKNRDPKLYVQPNKTTTLHEPVNICNQNGELPVLIIVHSAIRHFKMRLTIRKTWADHENYLNMRKLFRLIRDKNINITEEIQRKYKLQGSLKTMSEPASQQSSTTTELVSMLTTKWHYVPRDIIYDSEAERADDASVEIKSKEVTRTNTGDQFKVVFFVGLSHDERFQELVDDEAMTYGDVVQEAFVDDYFNMSLKSLMMLKWVSSKCEGKFRYILKCDDDVYVNTPYLMTMIRRFQTPEMSSLLLRSTIIGSATFDSIPILDVHHKWYCPSYMYAGKVYPQYIKGYSYILSMPTVSVLYRTALETPIFHFEDIYITGLCVARTRPHINLVNLEPVFRVGDEVRKSYCEALGMASVHVSATQMEKFYEALSDAGVVDGCKKLGVKGRSIRYEEDF